MKGTSHIIVGAAALVMLHPPALSLPFAMAAVANVLGSLGPDIDAGESTIRHATGTARSQGCLGRIASAVLPGHRGWVHSLWLAALIAGLCWWSGSQIAAAFAVGWVTHIAADRLMKLFGAHNGSPLEMAAVVAAICFSAWVNLR